MLENDINGSRSHWNNILDQDISWSEHAWHGSAPACFVSNLLTQSKSACLQFQTMCRQIIFILCHKKN